MVNGIDVGNPAVITTIAIAHRQAMKTDVLEIAQYLQTLLTRRLTAYIAGVKDPKTVTRWATGQIQDLRTQNEMHLRTAYEVVWLISQVDSARVAKAWMIGVNPYLGSISPAEAIHNGRLSEAHKAAQVFVNAE